MKLTAIDRWRSTEYPPPTPITDPFEAMRSISAGGQNGQIVFRCDAEFFAAITAGLPHDGYLVADESGRFEPGMPGTPNVPVPTFLDIPIIVQPSSEPVSQAVAGQPAPEPVPEPAMGSTTKTLQENQ